MSKKSFTQKTTAVAGAAVLLASIAVAEEKVVQLSEVPEAVKATIAQRAQGATPTEIELEDEDGKQIYSVEFKQDGKEREIEIALDGTFIKEETEDDDDSTTGSAGKDDDDDAEGEDDDDEEESIDPATAPDAVKKAFEPLLKGATIKKMTKESEDGVVVYEAEFDVAGKENSVNVSAEGKVLEIEKHIDAATLPPAVSAAVKSAHPTATMKSAEDVVENPGASEKRFFEVKLEEAGKTRELKIDASGKVLEDEDDD